MNRWKAKWMLDVPDWIIGITFDDKGVIYFSSDDRYVNEFNTEKNIVTTLIEREVDAASLVWSNGSLYICDFGNNRIVVKAKEWKVLAGNGTRKSVDGSFENASFERPRSIVSDSKGDLYVVDTALRKLDMKRRVVETINTNLGQAMYLCISSGDILYVTLNTSVVCKVQNGKFSVVAGSGIQGEKAAQGNLLEAQFYKLMSIAILPDDRTLLVLGRHSTIHFLDLQRQTMDSLFHKSFMCHPQELAVNKKGDIYVGVENGLVKLENIWKWERFLWLAHLKEDEAYCPMARLPKDLVIEIATHFLED